ncbi:MAG: TetR/AcrR family transcriptional regulator [Firmicutes bacterium]|nr:TetR/AcrR family transcriptional regulator [Bacillota bacterium]
MLPNAQPRTSKAGHEVGQVPADMGLLCEEAATLKGVSRLSARLLIMNKYQITTANKKAVLVNSALSLFKEKGFVDVSVKEIAAHARVSQVSLYNYFGSKEALVAECAAIVMGGTLQKAADILAEDIDFAEKINRALSLCTGEFAIAISNYFTQEALSDPVLVQLLFKNINHRKRKIYSDYVELGKREGAIDSTIPTDTILDFIDALGAMGGTTGFDAAPAKIKHIYQLLLYGLLGEHKA